MTKSVNDLFDAAMTLSVEDRQDLAVRLLDSLEPPDPDAEAAWAEELRRRIDDFRTGREKGIPWAEARRRIFAEPTAAELEALDDDR